MKNLLRKGLTSAFCLLLFLSLSTPGRAQMLAFNGTGDTNTLVPISVSIPDQWKNVIVREDQNGVATFGLANENAAPFFLFSVTEIPESQWAKTKTQQPDATLIGQKNGNIYYTQRTNKEKIKGTKSEVYREIYSSLDQVMSTIKVN